MRDDMEPPTAKINLADLPDIVCDKCGNATFEHVYFLKRLSKLLAPNGEEQVVPVGPPIAPPIFACNACGHVNIEFIPPPLLAGMQRNKTQKESGIISSTVPEDEPRTPIVKSNLTLMD